MNMEYVLGIVAGAVVGVVLIALILKLANNNGKMKAEYDERQKMLLGKGYKAGFYTMLIMVAILMIADIGETVIPVDMFLVYAVIFFVPLTLLCCVNIWNGAYFGLNNDVKRYCITFIALIAMNLFIAGMAIAKGTFYVDGEFDASLINLLGAIMMLIILVVILLRQFTDRKEEDEE